MHTLPRLTNVKRAAALIGATAAAAGIAAAVGAGPASAASLSASAKPAAATASSPDIAVHPNVVSFPCDEDYTVTGTYVNIRASYGTSARIVAVARQGDDFIASYRTTFTYNGYYWAYGEAFNSSGSVVGIGYMATAYLHDNGSAGCTVLS